MSTTLHWITLIAYVVGSLISLGFLIRQRQGFYRMGLALLWVGFGLHTLALAAAWVEGGVLPATSLRHATRRGTRGRGPTHHPQLLPTRNGRREPGGVPLGHRLHRQHPLMECLPKMERTA